MDFYPIESNLINGADDRPNAVFCVDIGGNQGHDLKQIGGRFPSIPGRMVLQDLEGVVGDMKSNFAVGSAIAFEPMVHDFTEPQPIKGMHSRLKHRF